jgi:hypothetical protein
VLSAHAETRAQYTNRRGPTYTQFVRLHVAGVTVIGNSSFRVAMKEGGVWAETLAAVKRLLEAVDIDALIVRRRGHHGSIVL